MYKHKDAKTKKNISEKFQILRINSLIAEVLCFNCSMYFEYSYSYYILGGVCVTFTVTSSLHYMLSSQLHYSLPV